MVLCYPINSNYDFREVSQYLFEKGIDYEIDYDTVWHGLNVHFEGHTYCFTAQGELWHTEREQDNIGAWWYEVGYDEGVLYIHGEGPSEDDEVYEVLE